MTFLMKFAMTIFIVTLVIYGSMAYAQTIPSPRGQDVPQPADKSQSSSQDKWQFSVTPYAWLMSMDTKATIRNYSVTSNINFSDTIKDVAFAGQMHFEAQKGKWGFFFDPAYLKITSNETLSTGKDVRLQIEEWLVELGGFYQLGKWSLDEKRKRSVTVDVLGGGRYWYLSTDLDISSITNQSKTTSWVDPFIGARLTADITEKVVFNIRGDIGGFSVGSDFSWNAIGAFGYRFTKDITGYLGYRALYVNYKAGTSDIRYEATSYGPIMGLSFVF
jgi:hypothetical protein